MAFLLGTLAIILEPHAEHNSLIFFSGCVLYMFIYMTYIGGSSQP